MYNLIAQALGLLGAVFIIGSYQFKKNTALILTQLIGSTLFVANYFMLGAFTGCFMNAVSTVRGLIFVCGDKTRKPFVLVLLVLSLLLGGIFTWQSVLSLLPLVGMLSVTVAMYFNNGKHIRMAQLFVSSPCWLVYNFLSCSIGGVICEVFVITSTVVSIVRYGFDGFEK